MTSVEEQIQQAIVEGKFANLRGKGKPFKLEENPLEDPEWRLAFHLLHENGFRLPWMEKRQQIETELEMSRTQLQRAWRDRQAGRLSAHDQWEHAVQVFSTRIDQINQQIFSYNLEVPLLQFHRPPINLEREIARLTTSPLSDTL